MLDFVPQAMWSFTPAGMAWDQVDPGVSSLQRAPPPHGAIGALRTGRLFGDAAADGERSRSDSVPGDRCRDEEDRGCRIVGDVERELAWQLVRARPARRVRICRDPESGALMGNLEETREWLGGVAAEGLGRMDLVRFVDRTRVREWRWPVGPASNDTINLDERAKEIVRTAERDGLARYQREVNYLVIAYRREEDGGADFAEHNASACRVDRGEESRRRRATDATSRRIVRAVLHPRPHHRVGCALVRLKLGERLAKDRPSCLDLEPDAGLVADRRDRVRSSRRTY